MVRCESIYLPPSRVQTGSGFISFSLLTPSKRLGEEEALLHCCVAPLAFAVPLLCEGMAQIGEPAQTWIGFKDQVCGTAKKWKLQRGSDTLAARTVQREQIALEVVRSL